MRRFGAKREWSLLRALFAGVAIAIAQTGKLQAQTYKVGDVVEDFSLVNRATGQPMKLSDFAGKIVFMDWFAHWCPFCKAAAPDLETGIKNHYRDRSGNVNGVEVVYVACNLQADSGSNKASTDAFVNTYGLAPVLQDTSRTLQRRFFPGGGQPTFVVINGVANSPSHKPWEIIYMRNGYGTTGQPIVGMQAAIDSIQKAAVVVDPPSPVSLREFKKSVSSEGVQTLSFKIDGNHRDRLVVEGSTDLKSWTPVPANITSDASTPVVVSMDSPARFFRAIRKP